MQHESYDILLQALNDTVKKIDQFVCSSECFLILESFILYILIEIVPFVLFCRWFWKKFRKTEPHQPFKNDNLSFLSISPNSRDKCNPGKGPFDCVKFWLQALNFLLGPERGIHNWRG